MEETVTKVKILGVEYQIVCPPEEKEQVKEAAVYLNQKLKEIRSNANIEEGKATIIAALNITNEYLKNLASRKETKPYNEGVLRLSSLVEEEVQKLSKLGT